MVPTKVRNHSAIFLEYEGEGILFDCGEGTQRQLKVADIAATKVTRLCITHWHGDHVLGIPGLIQTLGGMGYNGQLQIYGVPGSKKYLEYMFKGFANYVTIDFQVHEVKEGLVFETEKLKVECLPMEHSVMCLAFSVTEKDKLRVDTEYLRKEGVPDGKHLRILQEGKDLEWKGKIVKAKDATYLAKGRKFTYIPDTKYCKNAAMIGKDSDLIVTECTHSMGLEEKAEKYMHLTASQGAQIAKEAKAKQLVLTHFSQRFDKVNHLVEEAKAVFGNNVSAADDFKRYTIEKKH